MTQNNVIFAIITAFAIGMFIGYFFNFYLSYKNYNKAKEKYEALEAENNKLKKLIK